MYIQIEIIAYLALNVRCDAAYVKKR